ncbi:MAG: hypothetical protein P8Y65_10265 [Campylobacterales bacterium]|jgi:hypothetical protein
MYQTMTQIGKTYGVDAKTVGQILYELNIRDKNHPEQKGFPYEQAVTHGIAKAYTGRTGDVYYRYDIERIKEEFEQRLAQLNAQKPREDAPAKTPQIFDTGTAIETKLQQMLTALNTVLETGEVEGLHRLKGDIADIYALLADRT